MLKKDTNKETNKQTKEEKYKIIIIIIIIIMNYINRNEKKKLRVAGLFYASISISTPYNCGAWDIGWHVLSRTTGGTFSEVLW